MAKPKKPAKKETGKKQRVTGGGKKQEHGRYIFEQRRFVNKLRRIRRHVKRFPNDFAARQMLTDAKAGKLPAHRPGFMRLTGSAQEQK